MSRRQVRHTHISIDLRESEKRVIPQNVKAEVDKPFEDDNGVLCCPFVGEGFTKIGKPVVHAHIIPKSEQTILTKEQDVVYHPGNMFPTFDTIHEQIELHKKSPGLTLEYISPHPNQFGKDIYKVHLAPHITEQHMLLRCGVSAGQIVTMPVASRQFWHIHRQVFELCHAAASSSNEPLKVLNSVLSNLVINHIALPIVQKLALASSKRGRSSLEQLPLLSQQQEPSFKILRPLLLEKRRFELQSSWWNAPDQASEPEYYPIDILASTGSRRTFDIIARHDFVYQHEYDEIVRTYRGRYMTKFKDMVYEITFDDLVKNLRPGTLSSLVSDGIPGDQLEPHVPTGDGHGDGGSASFSGRAFERKQQKGSLPSKKKQTQPAVRPSVTKRSTTPPT